MIRQVARREIVTRGRSKSFRVTTAILVLLTIVGVVGAALFGSDDEDEAIEYDIIAPTELDDALTAATPDGVDITITRLDDAAARTAVSDDDVDAAVIGDGTIVYDQEPDPLLDAVITGALQRSATDQRSDELGVDTSTLGELLEPVTVDREFIDPPSDSESAETAVAFIGIFVMFFSIQIYGSQIAMVVVEEKSNRIVEVLLALVSPRDLLVGKVIGVGVLAAAQVAIPVVGLIVALSVSGFADVPVGAYASLPLLMLVFVLGFTMYGAMFALVGSLVSRQEDAQQALLPVFLPIFLGYVLAIQAVNDPDSVIATVTSVVPFTAPFALPVVVAQGAASPVVVIGAIALLIATTVAVLALAARIYEFTLLRTGSRIPLTDALRLARR